MAIRPIVTIAHLELGSRCREVDQIDDAALGLARDMLETMRASPACVGLAAPQIGVNLRAFVIDCSAHRRTTVCHGELVIFNPVVAIVGLARVEREGCMSVPDLTGDVARATEVVVEGLDLTGSRIEIESSGFEARAIQHEVDHLDGLLFLDRLSGPGALHQRTVYR
ncbi:MAG TPA: peptide deformylase [Acidimicrobiales bacterium]|nr:peptide deformylase [Acidimicrobiales bacterium]